LSTIGHPLADFTYHLMAWEMPEIGLGSVGLAGKPIADLGIPDEDAYIARYCERTPAIASGQAVPRELRIGIFTRLSIFFALQRSCRALPGASGTAPRRVLNRWQTWAGNTPPDLDEPCLLITTS
jgi:hypothetical protein